MEEPVDDQVAPVESMGEEPMPREDRDEPESEEEEQRSSVLFTSEQLEVLLKMGRPDFSELVAALKTGAAKGERFQPAKPGNFDGARDRKVVDAWLAEMDDYIRAAKVGRNSAVELAQSYLKGYVATWWWTVRQEEGKNHGYTWEFFKDRIEAEFIPRNSDYISRCKLRDLVNATNENLRQYVRAYSELMLEVRHMHEMDRVCQFVMGLPTWAKQKLEESWPASLSEAITKVENFSDVGRSDKSGFKKDNKFLHKKPRHEGEWNRGQSSPTKEKPKQGLNQNWTPTLGLRKLDPERGGKQGELAGTCACLKCIPKGWLVVWPTREVMTPLTYFKCSLGLGFNKPKCCFSYLDKQTFLLRFGCCDQGAR
jgi:hypothetical protein